MIYDYKEGGLRMVDFRPYMDSLKITWLWRLLGSECSSWAYLCPRILVLMIFLFLIEGGPMDLFPSQKLCFGGNRFCADVLTSWQKFTAVHKASTHGEVLKLHFGTTIKLRLTIRVFITSIGIQLPNDNGCYHININISTITLGNLNYNLIKK